MIVEAIAKLVQRKNLTRDESVSVFTEIMEGQASQAQIGAYLIAQRMCGETVAELAGAAAVMRSKATPVPVSSPVFIDTCGTGGDGSHTFNISTTAALVTAAAGIPVAKHGNRSVSSRSGSADVLKALGVRLEIDAATAGACVDAVGIGFLFAPALHGAMKHAIGPRRELGLRTIFNLLGPLTNPANSPRQLLGVFAPEWTESIATVLGELGSEHVWVVSAVNGGLDEISIAGPTQVSEFRSVQAGGDGSVRTFMVSPEDAGLALAPFSSLVGGSPEDNAEILRTILAGEKGPRRDAVVLNAAAGLLVGGRVTSLREGALLAEQVIDSGKAQATLQALVDFTNRN